MRFINPQRNYELSKQDGDSSKGRLYLISWVEFEVAASLSLLPFHPLGQHNSRESKDVAWWACQRSMGVTQPQQVSQSPRGAQKGILTLPCFPVLPPQEEWKLQAQGNCRHAHSLASVEWKLSPEENKAILRMSAGILCPEASTCHHE